MSDEAPERGTSSKKRRNIKIVVGVFVAYLVVSGLLVLAAAAPARAAQSTLSEVASGGVDAESISNGETERKLDKSASDLRSAHDRLDSFVLKPWRAVPVLGKQLTSAIRLTNAGSSAAQITHDTLQQAKALNATGTSDRVGTLRRISEITATQDQRLRQIELGPKGGLIGPLSEAREKAVDNLNKLDSGLNRGSAASAGLAELMSTNGNYLLVAANNAEMRNGSGMWLQVGLLKTGNNKMEVGDMEPVDEVTQPDGSIAWPVDMQQNWGFLGKHGDMRNLMLSPRFETSASLAKQIWERDGRQRVDGVVAIDVEMIESLLRITGPVDVAGQTLNADNIQRKLMFDQYQGVDFNRAANEQRREALSGVAGAVFNKFNAAQWEPASAARNLADAASGRHLMIWSADGDTQQLWRKAGISGDLAIDDTMVSLVNLGTNKMDQFMKVDTKMSTNKTDAAVETTMKVKVKNDAPQDGPIYVLGPQPGINAQKGDYMGFLALTLPHDATEISVNGLAPVISGRDGAHALAASSVLTARGQEQTFEIKFKRPASATGTEIQPSSHIPAMTWENNGASWKDAGPRRVTY